jgi:hypothetical protein
MRKLLQYPHISGKPSTLGHILTNPDDTPSLAFICLEMQILSALAADLMLDPLETMFYFPSLHGVSSLQT